MAVRYTRGEMRPTPVDDPEGPWIAVLCVGILLTALPATVCLGLIVLYAARIGQVQPLLACFAAGAVLMLGSAARLEWLGASRTPLGRR